MPHSDVTDVIVPQTVLDEVRHNKLATHKRLRALISDEARRFVVFSNVFHRATHTERKAGESANDCNDRAIRNAALWLQAQLGEEGPEVVLLTDDADNRRRAKAEGLAAMRVAEYAAVRTDAPQLLDLVARTPQDAEGGGGGRESGVRYAAHLPLSRLQQGLKDGSYHQGKLAISRHSSNVGSLFVSTLPGHNSIRVAGKDHLNRAMDGDVVVVKLLPQDQWGDEKKGAGEAVPAVEEEPGEGGEGGGAMPFATDMETAAETGYAEQETGSAAAKAKPSAGGRACGVVVGIVRRGWRPYVCVLEPDSSAGGGHSFLVEPVEKKIPKISITTRQAEILIGKLLVVSIDCWEANHRNPTGHYVRTIGQVGETAAETTAILLTHEVNTAPFSGTCGIALTQP